MSTRINVYVGGADLPERARRQQEGNRWRQGEAEQQRQINATQQAGQATEDRRTGRSLAQYRPEELAANRRQGGAYIIAVNINAFTDDNFDLYISVPPEAEPVKQPGSLDFTPPNEVTAYLWTQSGMSAEAFLATRAGQAIEAEVLRSAPLVGVDPPLPITIRSANKLLSVKPRADSLFSLKMVCTQARQFGNYGNIFTGFVDKKQFVALAYSDGDLNVGDELNIYFRDTENQRPTGWGGIDP